MALRPVAGGDHPLPFAAGLPVICLAGLHAAAIEAATATGGVGGGGS